MTENNKKREENQEWVRNEIHKGTPRKKKIPQFIWVDKSERSSITSVSFFPRWELTWVHEPIVPSLYWLSILNIGEFGYTRGSLLLLFTLKLWYEPWHHTIHKWIAYACILSGVSTQPQMYSIHLIIHQS